MDPLTAGLVAIGIFISMQIGVQRGKEMAEKPLPPPVLKSVTVHKISAKEVRQGGLSDAP